MYLILDIYPYFLNKPTQYVVDYQHPSPVHRWRQLVAIFVCVMFAVGTGTLVGLFLSFIGQENRPTQGSYEFKHFHDNSWWEVADDYGNTLIPYTYTTSVPTADVPCHPTLSSHPLNPSSHPTLSRSFLVFRIGSFHPRCLGPQQRQRTCNEIGARIFQSSWSKKHHFLVARGFRAQSITSWYFT